MRVEAVSASELDEASLVEETGDQAEPGIGGPQDQGDARSVSESSGARASQETSGRHTESEDPAPAEETAGGEVETEDASARPSPAAKRRTNWSRTVVFGVLPVLALLLAAGVGVAKWQDTSTRMSGRASMESVTAARESTVALLSYQPDSVEKDLGAARDRLTGKFKDSYSQLVHDVVIPGAKKDHIAAVATVPAAASVSATANHAVVLVFVDQTVTIGNDAPAQTSSTVRVTLDNDRGRWLISSFDPV